MMLKKSILIFGAGKIGRSFIGQLFGRSGYELVFVDIDVNLVNELNRRRSYPVTIKGDQDKTIWIKNVRAVSGHDKTRILKEILQASIAAISVGPNALGEVIPLIAEGLVARGVHKPLNIIIAENMRSAKEFFLKRLSGFCPPDLPIERTAGLIETSIGKMVPIMTPKDLENDPLMIYAEAYNTLIVDRMGFLGPIPEVEGISPKDNIKAWVDRKAFIHNLGHATAAYYGHFIDPQARFMYEVLDNNDVFAFTRKAMLQGAQIVSKHHPGEFSRSDLEDHIDDLLCRFRNRALKDTVFRVGCDLQRKLGISDRFAGAIHLATEEGLPFDCILNAMAYGFFFHAKNDCGSSYPADKLFLQHLNKKGIEKTLTLLCGYDPAADRLLIRELGVQYRDLVKSAKADLEI